RRHTRCLSDWSSDVCSSDLAWLDVTERAAKGEEGKGKDIAKHRNDVFRIAATLPGEAGPTIPGAVQEDLRKFLATFPVENKEARSEERRVGKERRYGVSRAQ